MEKCADQYAALAPYVFPDIENSSRSSEAVSHDFIDRLADLINGLGLEMGLKSVGIKAADVDRLSEDAMKQSRLLVNNPREVTLSDIKTIYQEAL
jgi:alcohol dehydrogenase class IV